METVIKKERIGEKQRWGEKECEREEQGWKDRDVLRYLSEFLFS